MRFIVIHNLFGSADSGVGIMLTKLFTFNYRRKIDDGYD
jgi:hypothetical protein